jgi:hypothetical protein
MQTPQSLAISCAGLTILIVLLAYAGVSSTVRVPVSVAMMAWAGWILTRSRLASNPLVPFFGVWLIAFSMHFGGVIEFPDDWGQAVPVAFLMAFVVLVLVGYALAQGGPPLRWGGLASRGDGGRLGTLALDLARFRHFLDFAALAGYVAALSFATEMIVYNQVNVMDPRSTRQVFQFARVVTPLTYLTLLTRSGGIIALVAGGIGWQWLSKAKTIFYLGSGLSIVVLSIVSAGRFIVLEVVMAGLFAIAVRRTLGLRVFKSRSYAYTAVGCVLLAVLYVFAVGTYRSDFSPEGNEQYMLATMHGDIASDLKNTWFSAMPLGVRSSVISTYANVGGPVRNFAIFWRVHSGPLSWGSLEFSIVSRNLRRVFPSIVSADEVLQTSAAEFAAVGEGGASWQTGVRDLIVDFGEGTALFVALLLGATIALLNARFQDEPSLATILSLCGMWIVCFHFTMYSIIGEPAVVVLLACGLLRRSSEGRLRR